MDKKLNNKEILYQKIDNAKNYKELYDVIEEILKCYSKQEENVVQAGEEVKDNIMPESSVIEKKQENIVIANNVKPIDMEENPAVNPIKKKETIKENNKGEYGKYFDSLINQKVNNSNSIQDVLQNAKNMNPVIKYSAKNARYYLTLDDVLIFKPEIKKMDKSERKAFEKDMNKKLETYSKENRNGKNVDPNIYELLNKYDKYFDTNTTESYLKGVAGVDTEKMNVDIRYDFTKGKKEEKNSRNIGILEKARIVNYAKQHEKNKIAKIFNNSKAKERSKILFATTLLGAGLLTANNTANTKDLQKNRNIDNINKKQINTDDWER